MQNDYLNNKKSYYSNRHRAEKNQKNKNLKSSVVDINILLNRIKITKKNKKKENLFLLGIASLAISVVGIVVIS